MARPLLSDYLQAHPFWVMDISNTGVVRVFDPALGFASVSAPEVQLEDYPIREGNSFWERHVVRRGTLQGFTARRGVTFHDSDFYIWMMQALTGGTQYMMGDLTYRKDLLLIHYFARSGWGPDPLRNGQNGGRLVTNTGDLAPSYDGVSLKIGPLEYAGRVPAKAYRLLGCVPTRWRSGDDFDAMNAAVSIAEIEFQCESVEEVSLAASARYLASLPFEALGL